VYPSDIINGDVQKQKCSVLSKVGFKTKVMGDIDQVTAQIRFGLDQLSAKNAHHEFEHVCRHLTRARICSNVLPATGPVAHGGDQGRDFETFRTYLCSSGLAERSFVGLVSDKPLAFACTLQKKQIKQKIKSDVKKIIASGSVVEGVHYFCSSDLAVAARHELIEWARKTQSIHLEIHDGQSLAELLSARDVFWIAEKYLSVPSEIYPRSSVDDGGAWYQRQLEEWKRRSFPPMTHADFSTLKAAGRHALSSEELTQDVPFWLGLLESFIVSESNEVLKRRSIYEVAYLSLKSMRTLVGQEDRLREYFAGVFQLANPAELEDAAAMMNYCAVVACQGGSTLTVEEVSSWRRSLIDSVEKELKRETTTNTLCLLLDLRGYLSMSIDPLNVAQPRLEDAIGWWGKLLNDVGAAPLYPLERLADRLTEFLKIFDEPAGYAKFAQRLDTLLAKRSGNFVAAQKCFDRAEALYEKRNLRGAINQLHQSKAKWFAAETLQHSLKSILFISHCYSELGLQLAAKYYALAAGYMALRANDPNILALSSAALATAAEYDYLLGAWCGFTELADIYLRAQIAFRDDPKNIERHNELQRTVLHTVILRSVTQKTAPELLPFVDQKIECWGIEDWVNDLRPQIEPNWENRTIPETWEVIGEQLNGVPFSDVGNTREVSWAALGVIWTVRWRNDYSTTIAAEQFIAVIQILLADIADVDLCLLKTTVDIELSLSIGDQVVMKPQPSNEGRKWEITLPTSTADDDVQRQQAQQVGFEAASSILYEISLIPEEQYSRALNNHFRSGLQSKIMVVQSYATVYKAFIPEDFFEQSDRKSKKRPMSPQPVRPFEAGDLGWRGGPGPGYSQSKAEKMLKARYSGAVAPIRKTLQRLLSDVAFRGVLERLRVEGWLDWHILNAISIIAVNYRVLHTHATQKSEEAVDRLYNELIKSEEPEGVVPISEFSEDAMRRAISGSMIHTLRLLDLECRQMTPDLKAIDHFLRFRYKYWIDDIAHDEIFSQAATSAAT